MSQFLNINEWNALNLSQKKICLSRPVFKNKKEFEKNVSNIIYSVKEKKDKALKFYTKTLDQVTLDHFKVSKEEIDNAYSLIDSKTIAAINIAKDNIQSFHKKQVPENIVFQVSPGIKLRKKWTPIDSVGLYIPGGNMPLLSTVLMLAIPAKISGCQKILLTTPPNIEGKVDPNILVAARECGIESIFKLGGAQAIGAMAFGTETIPKVDKIFGPGNRWVTEAKLQVSKDPSGATIDMPAGPSEVMIIADKEANSEYIAWDLLSQAEHGVDSQVMLVSDCLELVKKVEINLEKFLEELPTKKFALQSLANSRAILIEDLSESIMIANQYAPEHLIIQTNINEKIESSISNAGSIFMGPYSPESVGDYASGTNHVLPTNGYARSVGSLGLENFLKSTTVQELTKEGLQKIGPHVEQLAEVEGLIAHKMAVTCRLRGN